MYVKMGIPKHLPKVEYFEQILYSMLTQGYDTHTLTAESSWVLNGGVLQHEIMLKVKYDLKGCLRRSCDNNKVC